MVSTAAMSIDCGKNEMSAKGNTPSLSIVIATYNSAKTLERCLASIHNQSFPAPELIVIDGNSSDSTVEIIRRHEARLAYWHSRRDNGIYDAWNQALAHATGDYVCFLGSDDMLADPDALNAMVRAIGSERPDIVSGKGLLVDGEGRPIARFGDEWNYQAVRRHTRICHPGAWFRRDLFRTHGLFDERYRIVGDYAWLLRLPESTTSCFTNRVVVNVGHGGVSRTQVWLRLRERREAHARCPRIGPVRAYLYWADKLWRWPIARMLGLTY